MTYHEIAECLESFVRTQYFVSGDDTGFTRDVDLFESGYVDSIGLVELLAFINSNFEVEVPDDDLLSDEFSNIDGMAKVICREVKRKGFDVGGHEYDMGMRTGLWAR